MDVVNRYLDWSPLVELDKGLEKTYNWILKEISK